MFHKPKIVSLIESRHLVSRSLGKFYFVYEDKPEGMWWQKLLKKGYKHVFAVHFDGLFWVKMDFTIGYMDYSVLPFDYRDTIKDVLKGRDMTYQYVEAWRQPRYRVRLLFAPWTCVELMKSLLGIRAWYVMTPYQLYKYCEAHHGT